MRTQITNNLIDAIKEVEDAIISGNFNEIGSESRPSRLSGEDIKLALEKYGGAVTPSPRERLEKMEVFQIDNKTQDAPIKPEWFVDIDLNIDGKQSDLTLSLHIVSNVDGGLIALVDDLHIL